ncbi:MAG: protein phosphatase 2C domain-containing protein, partial [Muribaculaceae bacterium]|nr:protein phosphatase 2C domain-containing protein [Muribaculaceae bacterium]
MENFSDSTGARGSVESLIGGRSENQDSYGMSETRLGMLVVVCDGMGGGPAGKTASTIATQAILDFVSGSPVDRDPVSVLEDAGVAANEAVMAAVAADPALKGMGTTCVCVLICKGKAFVMHIGDSRC